MEHTKRIILRDYQESISYEAVSLLRSINLAYLAMECRCGKSLTALSAAEKYGAKRVLWLTKKKAMQSICSDYEGLKRSGGCSYDIEVLNYESAHKHTISPDLVVLDEAHCLGAYPKPSARTKSVKEICFGLPIIYLSGTPTPEGYSQIYHQLWCSTYSPFARYATFYKWAKDYVCVRQKKVNGYMLNDYSAAYEQKIMSVCGGIFLRFSQSDAGFSTNIVESTLVVPMSERTKEYLLTMKRHGIVEVDGRSVLGDTAAKKMSKMHQLSSGTIISEDGEHIVTDSSKADFIKKKFKGRIAIFYVYQSEADLLHDAFPNWTDNPEEFQSDPDKTFICQVRRAREGVRLDKADALIFFNLEYSYLSYEQGKNRLVSKERTAAAPVYFLQSDCGIEQYILEAVHNKTDFTASYYGKRSGT